MDDATRWKPLTLLVGRKYEDFQKALDERYKIFEPPDQLVTDQESGLMSDEIATWLEGMSRELSPLPTARGGSTGAHTAAGQIEANNRLVGRALRQAETAHVENGVPYTAKSLLS